MMDFLEKVAYRLRERHGNEMEKQTVVLPSRRAGLWLARALARMNDKPSWAPSMLTVSDLFRSFTDLIPADTETQIFELYRIYRNLFGEEITLTISVIINDSMILTVHGRCHKLAISQT